MGLWVCIDSFILIVHQQHYRCLVTSSYQSLVLFSVHAFSTGSQVLCGSLVLLFLSRLLALDHKSSIIYGSLVLLYLSMLLALDHKSSMGRLFYCICPCFQHWITSPLWVACSLIRSHTSPLWVTCFGVGRLFSYQVPHKSSVGHLFRCGSSVLLSSPTQVLCGSLVSVWVACSLLCVCVCVCACVGVGGVGVCCRCYT